VSMGGRANGQACADGERGPPSARAEILDIGKKAAGQKSYINCLKRKCKYTVSASQLFH
jgi:hypothetical protein